LITLPRAMLARQMLIDAAFRYACDAALCHFSIHGALMPRLWQRATPRDS